MIQALRLLLFALIITLAVPLITVYVVIYMAIIQVANRRTGISGTTYEPFSIRLLMHDLGTREDAATARLATALPATAPWLWGMLSLPMKLASRLSGYTPTMLSFPVQRPPSIMALLTLRTAFFDEALRDALGSVEQVVILGAGWDTRLYGLPAGAAVRCFEVDAPATSSAKQRAIAKAGIDASHVTFVAADFNRQSWLDALVEHGFDPSLPTFVLWEGVSMYLEAQAVDATLAAVAAMPAGSRIAFDYLAEELVLYKPPFRWIGWSMSKSISWTYGEHLVFGLPMARDPRAAAAGFVEARELELARWDAVPQQGLMKTPLYGFVVAGSTSSVS